MPEIRLEYFNACGRAELIRWILKVAKVDFEDYRYARPDGGDPTATWPANKPKTPFGQCPIVRFSDGKVFCQSMSIARYFATKYGLNGETPEEKAQCDQVVDCCMDLAFPRTMAWKEQDPTKKAELKKKWEEEQVPKFLGYFDTMLKENPAKSGWFVGNKMTWADMFFALNTSATTLNMVDGKIDWTPYPELKSLTDRVLADPAIAAWIKDRPQTRF